MMFSATYYNFFLPHTAPAYQTPWYASMSWLLKISQKTNRIKVKVNSILCSVFLPMKCFTFFRSGKGSHWARRWWKNIYKKIKSPRLWLVRNIQILLWMLFIVTLFVLMQNVERIYSVLLYLLFILEYISSILNIVWI